MFLTINVLLATLFIIYASCAPIDTELVTQSNLTETMNNTDVITISSIEPVENCVGPESCDYNGYCIDESNCRCDDGYTTHDSDPSIACNYKQKDWITAFLLHFFLGLFGAGNFYLQNTGFAVGQLVMFIVNACCCKMTITSKNNDGTTTQTTSTGILSIGIFIWWLVDCIRIGTGELGDGNGVDTYRR